MFVHPLAMVSDQAKLGEGCHVGPFCLIGNGVTLGPGNVLDSNVTITGKTWIGEGNRFFPGTVLGAPPQLAERAADCLLVINDFNVFREGVTAQGGLVPTGCTVIGSRNRLLAHSHVGHDCAVGDDVVISNGVALAGHVVVEDHAYLSGLVAVHQFVRIGTLSLLSAGSFADRSVPPYVIADGHRAKVRAHNRIGLERAGWDRSRIEEVRLLVRRYRKDGLRLLEPGYAGSPALEVWRTFADLDVRGIAKAGLARGSGHRIAPRSERSAAQQD